MSTTTIAAIAATLATLAPPAATALPAVPVVAAPEVAAPAPIPVPAVLPTTTPVPAVPATFPTLAPAYFAVLGPCSVTARFNTRDLFYLALVETRVAAASVNSAAALFNTIALYAP
jgi:hypothetical protein